MSAIIVFDIDIGQITLQAILFISLKNEKLAIRKIN